MMSPAQFWTPPGPSFVTARHLPDDVGAHCWMPASREQKVLVAGVAVGDQVPGERGRQPGRDGGLPSRGHGLQERQPPVRGPGDQHVRRPGRRPSRPSPPGPSPRSPPAPGAGAVLSRTFTGVSSAASTSSPASAASIASSNPAFPSCALTRAAALSTQPAETPDAEQHADDLRGPLRRHVPVTGQQHRGGVQRRPVGHRALVRARRRPRERDRPAARGTKDPAAPTRSPSG